MKIGDLTIWRPSDLEILDIWIFGDLNVGVLDIF